MRDISQVIIINSSIAAESFAAFDMSGHLADDIRVVGELIGHADEGLAAHVAGCYFVDRLRFVITSLGVANLDNAVHPAFLQYRLDALIVLLRTEEREETASGVHSPVFLNKVKGCLIQRNTHLGRSTQMTGLLRHILQNVIVYDIRRHEFKQITDTATYVALEDKDIALLLFIDTYRRSKAFQRYP